jgi:methionyl-tRNA formyltransferase
MKTKATECFVVASGRPWNRDLVRRLAKASGQTFVAISDPLELTAARLADLKPRYVFFPHWSHIIDKDIYENHECVIFHMTDLPYGRGGSPLQNLIVRGHRTTKISALRCVRELDAGPIYLKKNLDLSGTAEEIFMRADLVVEDIIKTMIARKPKPKAQRGEAVVFKRRTPDQSNLTQCKTLEEAFDLIRMLDADGYPAAFIEAGPFRLELSRAAKKVGGIVADVRITLANQTGK